MISRRTTDNNDNKKQALGRTTDTRTRTRLANNDSKYTASCNQNLPPPTRTRVFSFLAHGPIVRRCHLIVPRQSFPKVVFPYTLQLIRAYSNFLARVSVLSRGSVPNECYGLRYTTVLCRALPLLKCLFCSEGRAASMPCKRLFTTARPVLVKTGLIVCSMVVIILMMRLRGRYKSDKQTQSDVE
jgi:hypothetical protein